MRDVKLIIVYRKVIYDSSHSAHIVKETIILRCKYQYQYAPTAPWGTLLCLKFNITAYVVLVG